MVETYDKSVIGKRMRQVRHKRKMTIEETAEKSNISPVHYSCIERDRVGYTTKTLISICNALNTSLNYLLFGKQEEDSDDEIHKLIKTIDSGISYEAEEIVTNYIDILLHENYNK